MLKRLPVQIAIFFLLALILGLVNNTISSGKIPWVQKYQDLSKIQDKDTLWHPYSWDPATDTVFRLLNSAKAYQAFLQKEALFVDARILEEYQQGHIAGALDLDLESENNALFEMQLAEISQIANREMPIITYCAGTQCDASLMLARYLYRELGYKNVSIYFGGWNFWTQNNLPTEISTP